MPKASAVSPFPQAAHPDPGITRMQGVADKLFLPATDIPCLCCGSQLAGSEHTCCLRLCMEINTGHVFQEVRDLLFNSHLDSGPLKSQGSAWDNPGCVFLHPFVELVLLYCSDLTLAGSSAPHGCLLPLLHTVGEVKATCKQSTTRKSFWWSRCSAISGNAGIHHSMTAWEDKPHPSKCLLSSFLFPLLYLLSMMSCGMGYFSGHLGSAVLAVSPSNSSLWGVEWGAENALTVDKPCSATTKILLYHQHCFQHKPKPQPHPSYCEVN